MKPLKLQKLTILFDGECSLCSELKGWLMRQRSWIRLEFIPFQQAHQHYPDLTDWRLDQQVVAVGDDRWIYYGDNAWLMILWSMRKYRRLSLRFSHPHYRPMMKKLVYWVSTHRHELANSVLVRMLREFNKRAPI